MTEFLTFLIGWGARSALVVGLAFVLCALARQSSAAVRHVVWRAALSATLVVGIGMLVATFAGVKTPRVSPLAQTILAPQIVPAPEAKAVTLESIQHPPTPPVRHVNELGETSSENGGNPVLAWLGFLYVVGATILTVRWLASLAYMRHVSASGQKLAGYEGVLVVDNRELKVPCTFGWRRPAIVLPGEAFSWPSDRTRAVLTHERAHVARNDWFWQGVAAMTVAVQWFNPAIWLLASALRSTAEDAADNEVLAAGIAPSVYVKELMAFAPLSDRTVLPLMNFANRNGLARRLRGLLAPGQDRRQAGRRVALSTTASFGLLGVALSAYSPAQGTVQTFHNPPPTSKPFAFSNGVAAKIIYVGSGSSLLPTWTANGEAMPAGEPKRRGFGYGGSGNLAGTRNVAVCFELPPLSDTDEFETQAHSVPLLIKLSGAISKGGVGAAILTRKSVMARMFIVPQSWSTASLEIGRGVGTFQPAGEWSATKKDFPAEIERGPDSHSEVFINGKRIDQGPGIPTSVIRFTLPPAAENRQWRILAFGHNNQRIEFGGPFVFPSDGLNGKTYEGQALVAPTEIDHLRMEVRDYEWMQVKDLHLYPQGEIRP